MVEDVIKSCKQCLVCLRNKKFKFQEHEAMALEIEGIGDRTHIDIVGGLPPAGPEGFCRVACIIDGVASNGDLYALTHKSDDEVYESCLTHFSFWGVPKVIVSDNGGEFNGKLLKFLLTTTGVDHRTTAPYNPRANGKVERVQQTLIESLRCHCETNPHDWHKSLKWVMWAWRTRVNPITGYSPHMLTMGREMNRFEDWSHKDEKNESIQKMEVLQRAREISDLLDAKQERAMIKLGEAQIIQKRVQDERVGTRLRREALPNGTAVMIKRDGIIPKLSARFSGPFITIRRTANLNYELQDILGNRVITAYPLHKLKICDQLVVEPGDFGEIDLILDHKRENDQNIYLVQWKNDPITTWVPEEFFNTMECINKYFEKLDHLN